jgi:transposase InsO family protein
MVYLRELEKKQAKYFGKMDLTAAYHQAPVHENTIALLAFICFMGVFEWLRLPFGPKKAPPYFQEMMATVVLLGLLYFICELYLDDILVYGNTEKEFVGNLRKVFVRLRLHNVKIKPAKCEFGLSSLEYVGKVLSKEGLTMSKKKIDSVLNFPLPQTHKELKSAVGLFNYFRDFIKNQSDIARPLHQLLIGYDKKARNKKLNWNAEARIAFSHMQDMIAKCPLLHFLQKEGQIVLTTDASRYGIGGYLTQIIDNIECPIAFVSKSLNKAQIRWSTFLKEMYAIYIVCMMLMHLLRDREFIHRTDHLNIINLHLNSNPMVVRWDMALQELDLKKKWAPGTSKELFVPDAFSRLCENKMDGTEIVSTDVDKRTEIVTATMNAKLPLHNGSAAPTNFVSATLGAFKISSRDFQQIALVHNGVCGHMGVDSTIQRLLKAKIELKYMRTKVKKFIHQCPVCQKTDARKVENNGVPFTSSSDVIMDVINMDFLGPFPDGGYVLTVIDKFSRWVELYSTDDATALSAAECLLNHFGRYGSPKFIQSDNGPHFVAEIIKDFIAMVGSQQFLTVAYSKQENAIVERSNKEINRHLRTLLFDRSTQDDYRHCLPLVQRIINSSVSVRTGYAPSELVFGKALDLDRGIFIPQIERTRKDIPTTDYVKKLMKLQDSLLIIAKENLISADAIHMQENNKWRAEFENDSYVLVRYNAAPPTRVHTLWRGPLKVISSEAQHYTLYDLVVKREKIVHVSFLKPFIFDPDRVVPLDIARRDYGEYFVEKIIAHRGNVNRKTQVQFLVQWLGYEEEDNTWEPYKFLRIVPKLHEYLRGVEGVKGIKNLIPKEFRV